MWRLCAGFVLGVTMAWAVWTRMERDFSMCPPEAVPTRRQRALGIDPRYLREFQEKEAQRANTPSGKP